MALFGKKKEQVAVQEQLENTLRVELKLNQKATDKQVVKTKKVVKDFNNLIQQNGFTLTIQSAAGGKK